MSTPGLDEIRVQAGSPVAIGARLYLLAGQIHLDFDRLSGGRGTAEQRAAFAERLGVYELMMTGAERGGGRASADEFFELRVAERVARVRADLVAYQEGQEPA